MRAVTSIRRVMITAVVTMAGIAAAMAPPTAATAAPTADTAFSAQARAAHLSRAQSAALQAEVNRYLAGSGGRQVSLNKIDLNGTGAILVAIPGEDHPRDFTAGDATTLAADPCLDGVKYSGWFCAYSKSHYKGTRIGMYGCGLYYDVSKFTSGGSWVNDQTRGTRAVMYAKSGERVFVTRPSYSFDATGNWANVELVFPC
ncbi:hypothetical protein KZ829_18815 [Actinoplanes hulinensis]|uniref:Secreted protein n=1 Tax=Actinoplanes hulinensis TaxID=1144547 RepID=A0ABS7B433_9ACTN|nr:hypothetical protein [Actinoplanes hulinensis]MBW6435797.1 hypothetical protein [Actinoplanes hulinensis]